MLDGNPFDNLEMLEQKCPKCKTILDFGINTEFDENLGKHVCLKCRTKL
jgi:phage FluMu protein Com